MKDKIDSQTTQHHAEQALFKALAAIKNPMEAEAFMKDLCTPAELQALADRWLVVEPLKRGIPYREIQERTGVSVTTIGRVARSLSLGSGGYEMIYQRLETSTDE